MSRTFALDAPPRGTLDDVRALIGGKATNLGVMVRDLGLPVPPGFVITTLTCRTFLHDGWPADLDAELRARMGEVEVAVGRRFGDPEDPLLVSVRSGAPVSMPGMMDTILNVGLNDQTARGLAVASGDPAFAASCRDRFEVSFSGLVGTTAPADPWQQLRLAAEAVFHSWTSDRAVAYRRKERIPDDLGTAVTVQAMVFGNRGARSATGVAFTRNPATGKPELYGDVLFDAQGDDVVAGTHQTEPLAVLDERLPDVAAELRAAADRLERHLGDLADIEFTIEDGRLWLLQVRVGKRSPRAALRIAVDMAEDPSFPLDRESAVRRVLPLLAAPPTMAEIDPAAVPILTGLPASPGIGSGPIALTADAAVASAEAGTPAILVRSETSPNDVHGMARAAGVVTARGGLASHAAVVARGWGIPAVVGAEALVLGAEDATVGDRRLRAGAVVTIDGSTGHVYQGAVVGATTVVPEVATLLGWARELGIPIGEDSGGPDAPSGSAAEVSADDVVRRLATKGFATAESLADALIASVESVGPIVDDLVAGGLAKTAAGALRLTDAGSARAAELLAADREAVGSEAASAALDAFHALDTRMKEIVTAWQLRPRDGGEPEMNDHSDAAYDASVLERLGALHLDVESFLEPLEAAGPRLDGYRTRLGRALERAQSGDQKYVASPRVDSYHGAWFELHEDLINLAGRTREAEVAAGRA